MTIDKQTDHAEAAIEHAIGLLRQTLEVAGTRSLMILCDPILANPVAEQAEILRLPAHRLQFSYRDLGNEHKPYLLLIDDEVAQERFVNLSIRIAVMEARAAGHQSPSPRSVCTWLLAPLHQAPAIRQALSSRVLQTPPHQNSNKRIFRFWDPRVFDHLPRILGASEANTWLGCTAHWLWIDSSGTMRKRALTANPNTVAAPLTRAQWSALERLEDLNQVLQLTNSLDSTDFLPVAASLDRALMRAQSLKLTQSLDRVTYATLTHSLGGYFEDHPSMREYFRATAQGASLSDQLALIDQNTWDELRADLKQINANTRSAPGVTP